MGVKSVLVTGASTGIGEACALRLDRLGHRVYAGVRSEEHARGLRQRGSDRLMPVFLDVTDQAQIDAVAKQASSDGGRLRRFPPFRVAVWRISIDILAIQIWTF